MCNIGLITTTQTSLSTLENIVKPDVTVQLPAAAALAFN